jgi:P4 family phage/plasmid primase-like protien
MYKEYKKFISKNLVVFGIEIKQKQNKKNIWKKDIKFPQNWTKITLTNASINKSHNGLALLTGEINNIIIIDIDNIEHWNDFLSINKQQEPDTVSVKSGSGGVHYYFKYNKELENITSKDHCFGKDYDIDIKTNGGCVIAPPSTYHNKNMEKDVSYIWNKSIFDYEPSEMPDWIQNLLLNKKKNTKLDENIKDDIKNNIKEKITENKKNDEYDIIDLNDNEQKKQFNSDDIEQLIDMLSMSRCASYNEWINVGLCLYNIDQTNLYIWRKWSRKSDKYESGICEDKWKSFKKEKSGLKIGSLLSWCKNDNKEKYELFMKRHQLNEIILSKFPNDKLELGDMVIVNDKCNYTHLHNNECLIKGDAHQDLPKSMYIEMLKDLITIKCRHPECFGKVYPCQHIQLSTQEMNIAFNSNVNITINNNVKDDELVEFQQINLFDDDKLNEIVYNSLNGEPVYLAELIYYYYGNDFYYGEDNNWYSFENHKWKNIGNKNLDLRNIIHKKLKEIYSQVVSYYKDIECDKNKIKALRNVMKTFGETMQKNNIITELIELYTINKNKNRDFTKKLDADPFLIGFENGIYDLKKFEFREGERGDFLTMSVGYDYSEKHTEKYHELITFLEDILPNKEERDYTLTYLSIGLVGNLLELFTILTGCGRNGKSKIIELLGKTFGEYFGSVQSQLFTRPRPDANSPDPGLLNLLRKRIVIASEPEKNSKLNSGFIKFLTGRDSTSLRNCHSNDMIEFTARFITLFICNDIPECDDIDNAFSKRLRCINFPTEFVDEPKKPNQKKINVNINENFNFWKLDFMLILIDYYKKYTKTKELRASTDILTWTNQYKENTDLYLQFLHENIEETGNDKDRIHCVEMYGLFKSWFKYNNPNEKVPSNKEFCNNMRKYREITDIKIDGITKLGTRCVKFKNQ